VRGRQISVEIIDDEVVALQVLRQVGGVDPQMQVDERVELQSRWMRQLSYRDRCRDH